MRRRLILGISALPVLPRMAAAQAIQVRVLSAGALEPGLTAALARLPGNASTTIEISYATAPQLRDRLASGENPDVLIAPVGLVNELATAGRLTGERATLGRVGIGLVTRQDAVMPEIGDLTSFKHAIAEAERVVFNRASTGLYLERLFDRLGMAALVASKAVRYATGAEVLHHIVAGSGRELGLAPIPEILMVQAARFVGPLPTEIQNFTAYAVAILPNAPPAAAALFSFLSGAEAREALRAAGVEPIP